MDQMASNAILPGNNCDTEFLKAHELFFDALSGSEKSQFKPCTSSEELLDEVKKFVRFKGEKRNWIRPFECIKKFSDSLSPYFDIIGTFIQSNPQWSAIAWGIVRFILQVRKHSAVRVERHKNTTNCQKSWQTTSLPFSTN
jgi:hypothetical protein